MRKADIDLPGTLERSPKKAQDTDAETLASAIDQYGDGEQAHRTAFASLKHSLEKVGDHWEPKEEKGPSDQRSKTRGAANRNEGETAGGVDVEGHTRAELDERAKELDVSGRSAMTKLELAQAIARTQD